MTKPYDYFNENLQKFYPDQNIDPEKYNLYNGLCALSEEVETLRFEVSTLLSKLAAVLEQARDR